MEFMELIGVYIVYEVYGVYGVYKVYGVDNCAKVSLALLHDRFEQSKTRTTHIHKTFNKLSTMPIIQQCQEMLIFWRNFGPTPQWLSPGPQWFLSSVWIYDDPIAMVKNSSWLS